MMVKYCDSEFEIPDVMIEKFVLDFNVLPGSAHRDGVYQLRDSINEVIDLISEEPDLLHDNEYLDDFIKALAMRQALAKHGILYDA
jgi:hypothetical protein